MITFSANEHYRDPNKPAFATATFKGGGDAASAARAVLETGEFDYAWNLQVEPEVLAQMAAAGKGTVVTAFGTSVERLMANRQTTIRASAPRSARSTSTAPTRIPSCPIRRCAVPSRSPSTARSWSTRATAPLASRPATCCRRRRCTHRPPRRVQDAERRRGEPHPRRGGLDAGRRRGADQGRGAPLNPLPDLHQLRAPGHAGADQADVGADRVETELRNIDAAVFFAAIRGAPTRT